jgi:high-affinity K+ transport system ATPase subunit B
MTVGLSRRIELGLKANLNENRQHNEVAMISLLIGILIIVVVGAICFWAIDKFAPDARLANLLKLLVILVCLGAIVQRLMVLVY